MAKPGIQINLLPAEFAVAQKGQQKFRTIQTICIGVVVFVMFLAAGVVILSFLQSKNLAKISAAADEAETQVNQQKSKEADLVILKNRVQLINKIMKANTDFPVKYSKINSLIPDSVSVTAFNLDKTGLLVLSLIIPDRTTLSQLTTNMISGTDKTGIQSISIENLGRSKDGTYRATFKLGLKAS